MDTRSSSYTTFVLRVDTQTPGWEKSMIKLLDGIPGATFSIDANGLARVSGYVDPGKTLKLLAKAGKHAQLHWIDSGTTKPSEKRDHDYHHHFNDPHGSYWQANHHQYHHQPHPLPPPPPPPPQYLPQYPSMPAEHFYGSEPSQCMIM